MIFDVLWFIFKSKKLIHKKEKNHKLGITPSASLYEVCCKGFAHLGGPGPGLAQGGHTKW